MKRIFTYLSILAVAALSTVSCVDKVFPIGTDPTPAQPAAPVDIQISNVTDYSFDVTISVTGKAAYYSYLVDNDEPFLDESGAVAVAAEEIYAVAYDGVAQGTVKYAEKSSITFTVDADPNNVYTVYAVASSEEGNVGEVKYKRICTSDTEIPEIEDYDYEDDEATFYLLFSEGVEYDETKSVTATLYAGYYTEDASGKRTYAYLDDSMAMGKATATVTVEDDVVILDFGKQVSGTVYAVNFPEGTFVDYVGNKCEAVVTTFKSGVPSSEFVGEIEQGIAEVVEPKVDAMKDYNQYITISTKTYVQQVFSASQLNAKKIVPVTFTIFHTEKDAKLGEVTTEKTYTLSGAPYYGAIAGNQIGVKLSAEPERGDYVSISIPEGAWVDVYGNASPAIEIGPVLYAYGFEVEDIVGTWSYNASSMFTGEPCVCKYVIAASDDAKKGNIMFTTWCNVEDTKLYADFDGDLGVITVPSLYYEDIKTEYLDEEFVIDDAGNTETFKCVKYWCTYAYYSVYNKQKTGLKWTTKDCQTISSINDYPGWYYEEYVIPAGGEDEITDDDLVDYDYDMFNILTAPAKSTVSSQAVSSKGYMFNATNIRCEKTDMKRIK